MNFFLGFLFYSKEEATANPEWDWSILGFQFYPKDEATLDPDCDWSSLCFLFSNVPYLISASGYIAEDHTGNTEHILTSEIIL